MQLPGYMQGVLCDQLLPVSQWPMALEARVSQKGVPVLASLLTSSTALLARLDRTGGIHMLP